MWHGWDFLLLFLSKALHNKIVSFVLNNHINYNCLNLLFRRIWVICLDNSLILSIAFEVLTLAVCSLFTYGLPFNILLNETFRMLGPRFDVIFLNVCCLVLIPNTSVCCSCFLSLTSYFKFWFQFFLLVSVLDVRLLGKWYENERNNDVIKLICLNHY